jgi:hypothetical protein
MIHVGRHALRDERHQDGIGENLLLEELLDPV